jgi:hypothetical protein
MKDGGHVTVDTESAYSSAGRPVQHDWDAFWVEVAFYTAANDLNIEDRPSLQTHMVTWSRKNMKIVPNKATIRSKIRLLFERLARERGRT